MTPPDFLLLSQTKVCTNTMQIPAQIRTIGSPNQGGRLSGEMQLFLLHQYSWRGAPQIWNGDEVGMWGGDDPECRKPVIWEDLEYEAETRHILPDRQRPRDEVSVNNKLFGYYQQMIRLRKAHPALRVGDAKFLLADDEAMTLAYSRPMVLTD